MIYHIVYNGQTIGPMSKEQMSAYAVDANTMVSCDGGEWRPLYTYPELMDLLRNRADSSTKTLCGIFAIVLGGIGLHYFLVGKTAGGIINIILSLVTCGLWCVIDFIQGIMILTMSDEEWRRKFVDSTSAFPVF